MVSKEIAREIVRLPHRTSEVQMWGSSMDRCNSLNENISLDVLYNLADRDDGFVIEGDVL